MSKFKTGDRLRIKATKGGWSNVEGTFLRADQDYTWIVPDVGATYTTGKPIPDSYRVEGAGFYHDSYDLIESETYVLKVGDRVRVKKSVGHWGGIAGVYVARRNDGYGVNDYFRPDVGSVYANGDPIIYDYPNRTEGVGIDVGALELVEAFKTPEQIELEELRAFKAEALEKFPQLRPVDPDLVVARQMAADESGNTPNRQVAFVEGQYDNSMRVELRLEGIKMGRKLAADEAA